MSLINHKRSLIQSCNRPSASYSSIGVDLLPKIKKFASIFFLSIKLPYLLKTCISFYVKTTVEIAHASFSFITCPNVAVLVLIIIY